MSLPSRTMTASARRALMMIRAARPCGAALLVGTALCLTVACPGPEAPPPPEPELEPITMERSIPVVPHRADNCLETCLECHGDAQHRVPPPRPERTECLLCHVVVHPLD